MYSVLLVDDHILFREGLHGLIDQWDDFTVVGEATNGSEAIAFCGKNFPDLVLMDITMPGMDGLEATQNIRKLFPLIRIVLLTVSEDEQDLFKALELGENGYMLKNTPSRRLRDMLRGVMLEKPYLDPSQPRFLTSFRAISQERMPQSNMRKS